MESTSREEAEGGVGVRRTECCPLISANVRCVVTVTCCFLFSCTLGLFYAFGNINPYMTSYLRNRTGDHHTDYTDTIWVFQANSIIASGLMAPIGIVATRLHPKVFLCLSFLCHSGSLFGTYWSLTQSFPLVVLTYGILGGIPLAGVDPVSIRISVGWSPGRQGLICSTVLMGYGVGAVVWNELTTWFINPHNLQPDVSYNGDVYYSQPQLLDRVPQCFLLLGGICGGMQLLGILLLCLPPVVSLQQDMTIKSDEEEKRRLLDDDDDDDNNVTERSSPINSVRSDSLQHSSSSGQHRNDSTNTATSPQPRGTNPEAVNCGHRMAAAGSVDYTPWQVLKSRVFWTLWLLSVFSAMGYLFVISLFKAYGQSFIPDDHFLALVASLSSVCNAVGRPLWGHLSDRIGYRNVLLMSLSVLTALVGSFVTCEVTGKAGFVVWVCAMFLSMGGFFSVMYTLAFALFGPKYYSINMGLLASNGVIGIPLGGLVAPALKEALGWHGMFFVGYGGLFVALLLAMSLTVRWGNTIPRHMWPVLDLP